MLLGVQSMGISELVPSVTSTLPASLVLPAGRGASAQSMHARLWLPGMSSGPEPCMYTHADLDHGASMQASQVHAGAESCQAQQSTRLL